MGISYVKVQYLIQLNASYIADCFSTVHNLHRDDGQAGVNIYNYTKPHCQNDLNLTVIPLTSAIQYCLTVSTRVADIDTVTFFRIIKY